MNTSSSFPRKQPFDRTLPEVADREPENMDCHQELNLSLDPATGELEDLATFKVFLKKNLPYEQAPTDLLAKIYDRVDAIKADRKD